MTPRILIAGIGNIFLGDDAFGVEVIQRLAQRTWPEGVRIVDFGIRGFDLAAALLEGWDYAILIDTAPRGAAPGTLYVIEPELDREGEAPAEPRSEAGNSAESRRGGAFALPAIAPAGALDGHRLDPVGVLALVKLLGGPLPRILLVGCEPARGSGTDEVTAELSAPVRAAVVESIKLVESLIAALRRPDPRSQSAFTALFQGRTEHGRPPHQAHAAPR
jgi:hydrogenase maturation protease